MAHSDHRRGPERRRLPRGGRRVEDAEGFAPLVLVVGPGDAAVQRAEAVLARLKFAVTTSPTVEEALRVMSGIRPDVVVADASAASRIRLEAPEHVPVVELNDEMETNAEALLEGIRQTIRANAQRVR
jgi:hypothetical protein